MDPLTTIQERIPIMEEIEIQAKKFRHTAGFGKRIEFYIIGRMLKAGLDVYIPLVDDNAVDAIIKKSNGQFIEIQIKARSDEVKLGDGCLFAAMTHEIRQHYHFVFYSERHNTTFIMSSEEYLSEAVQNKNGKNAGKRSIWFNGTRKVNGARTEYVKDRYKKYICEDFSKLK